MEFPLSRFGSTLQGGSMPTSAAQALASEVSGPGDSGDLQVITDLLKRDPFYELSEQDKACLWRARDSVCRRLYPAASLPWLVQAVAWERRELVEELYRLLAAWPRPLPVDTCLKLLGVAGLSGAG